MTVKLPRLVPGSTVALEAAAGGVEVSRIDGAVAMLEEMGYHVRIPRDLSARDRYFAGSDAERLAGLQSVLDDSEVKAVFLARGGYGSQRIAPNLKKPATPKPVVGFSDNTALLGYLGNAFGWPTVYGPHPRGDHQEEFARVVELLSGGDGPLFSGLTPIRDGKEISGPVTGGCLSLLSSTAGTPCFMDMSGRIVFIEDIAEAPYRLDRMLTHLRQAGAFDRALGVVFGRPESFAPEGDAVEEVIAVLEDFASHVKIPVVYGLPSGHVEPNHPLPLGPIAKLSTASGTLKFLEQLTEQG